MIEGKSTEDRHVIPRWRSIQQSQLAGEFDSIRTKPVQNLNPIDAQQLRKALEHDFFRERKAWVETQEVAYAEELLTSALALNERDDPELLSASIAVLSAESTAPAMAQFAEEIVHGRVGETSSPSFQDVVSLRSQIVHRKQLLALNPRDGLLTAEKALLHLNLGQHQKTKKLLEQAIRILPDNRYVLRALARFWCHEGEPDRALSVLSGSARTKSDPWLKAAEMAIEALSGNSPKKWKASKELVRSGNFSDRSLSELASQIGTFELEGGSRKQGMNMLRISALSPTENAVAQIEFIGRETAVFEPDEILGNAEEAYEAAAHKAYWKNHWDEALDACESWHLIEPFSTRPAVFGTFVASVRSTSLERSLALATSVLNANPDDGLLLNNLAVIHAYMGDSSKAREAHRLSKASNDSDMSVTHKATQGLLEFRAGNFEEGARNYEAAVKEALDQRQYKSALRAYCFLGREMTRIGPEWADFFGQEIDQTIKKLRARGIPIPRDVEIIREQYSNSKPSDFGPLSVQVPALSNGID